MFSIWLKHQLNWRNMLIDRKYMPHLFDHRCGKCFIERFSNHLSTLKTTFSNVPDEIFHVRCQIYSVDICGFQSMFVWCINLFLRGFAAVGCVLFYLIKMKCLNDRQLNMLCATKSYFLLCETAYSQEFILQIERVNIKTLLVVKKTKNSIWFPTTA